MTQELFDTKTETDTEAEADQLSDATLVSQSAEGDASAFAVLVRRYTPLMRAYAARILPVGSPNTDDVLQEAFLAAWERLPELQDPDKLKSWLLRITGHKAIDFIRKNRVTDDVDDIDIVAPEHESPAARSQARAELAALNEALNALPLLQRQCWILREVSDYSYDDIAIEMHLPLSTVRGLLARARKTLLIKLELWR